MLNKYYIIQDQIVVSLFTFLSVGMAKQKRTGRICWDIDYFCLNIYLLNCLSTKSTSLISTWFDNKQSS